jgi:ornithine cyclodeaminase
MTQVLKLKTIKKILAKIDPLKLIEEGFIAYSRGEVVVPPVGEMIFDDIGECHIKYGFIKENDYFVVKIAQGFYNNPKIGLPSSNGVNILFSQKTGEVLCILLDEGHLTDIRTAAAGAVVAKYMAPENVNEIGIYGTGTQGKLQLKYLKGIIDCQKALVWGRSQISLDKYKEEMKDSGFIINTTLNAKQVTDNCNLIITCTPSKIPLIKAKQVAKGTHITAIGSDTPVKQELESKLLKLADRVVVDSISQARSRGECYHALKDKQISEENLIELGNMISDKNLQRASNDEITIADLTGVAIQDIQISKAIYEGVNNN